MCPQTVEPTMKFKIFRYRLRKRSRSRPLAEKFDYRKTFYYQEPRLDISDAKLARNLIDSSDFIIFSDVFEHLVPPISRAFKNVRKILSPGAVHSHSSLSPATENDRALSGPQRFHSNRKRRLVIPQKCHAEWSYSGI